MNDGDQYSHLFQTTRPALPALSRLSGKILLRNGDLEKPLFVISRSICNLTSTCAFTGVCPAAKRCYPSNNRRHPATALFVKTVSSPQSKGSPFAPGHTAKRPRSSLSRRKWASSNKIYKRENDTSFILPALPTKRQPCPDPAAADRPFEGNL